MPLCAGSPKESISEEDPLQRPSFAQQRKQSSDCFPDVPEDDEPKACDALLGRRAEWQGSALFSPAPVPSHATSSSRANDTEAPQSVLVSVPKQTSLDTQPHNTAGDQMMFATAFHGGVMPNQAQLNAQFGRGESGGHGHLQQNCGMQQQFAPVLVGQGPGPCKVGMATDFPAAYPIRHSFTDEPAASVYNGGVAMDVPACVTHAGGFPDRYGWGSGAFGPLSLGVQSVAGHSGSWFGSDSDLGAGQGQGQLMPAPFRTFPDVTPAPPFVPMQVQPGPAPAQPSMQHGSSFLMPAAAFGGAQVCAQGDGGRREFSSGDAQPMVTSLPVRSQLARFIEQEKNQTVSDDGDFSIPHNPRFLWILYVQFAGCHCVIRRTAGRWAVERGVYTVILPASCVNESSLSMSMCTHRFLPTSNRSNKFASTPQPARCNPGDDVMRV